MVQRQNQKCLSLANHALLVAGFVLAIKKDYIAIETVVKQEGRDESQE
jgi:hypothetical protein